jgi:hypothetical protein
VLGSASVRWICLTALIALVVQFGLGSFLNLYARQASSTGLSVHIGLGLALICTAIALLVRGILGGSRLLTGLAATGLIAILGAFASGEIYVRNHQMSASLSMAILTGVALVAYISVLNLTRDASRQPSPQPSVPQPSVPQRSPYKPPTAPPLPEQRSASSGSSGPPPWMRPGFATTSPHPYPAPVSAPVPAPAAAHTGLPPWESQGAMPPPKLPVRKPFTGESPKLDK